tara:strand:+ start:527 stop:1087 length:561 start_codon:yes stop_codon:yes gene_type:complete
MKARLILLFFLFGCQSSEIIEKTVFDNSQLEKITISGKNLEINELYESKFTDEYIDHSLTNPPILRLKSWIKDNINTFGNENILVINILDASLKRTEENNIDAKKFDDKIIYKYELFYLVEYNLYDDLNYLISNTTVEGFRSTTSSKYISLQETEQIIDDLILLTLIDFTNESKKLIQIYMKEYLL